MKHILVYAGLRDGNTTITSMEIETAHRRLRKENRPIIEAAIKDAGFEDYVILNVIRVRDW